MWHQGITLIVLTLWWIGSGAAAGDDAQAKITRARTVLHLLIDGKYDEFVAAGDAKVEAAMNAEAAEKVWAGITSRVGAYRSEVSAQSSKVSGNDAVQFVCRFERGKATLLVVLNKDDLMSGFWITALDAEVPYKAPDYVNPSSFREEKVTVSAGKFPLPGTLAIPKAAGPHPAIVLVHGSGPHDQDETVGANQPFRDLAGGLASQGVAVLRYEKRTHKHPTSMKADEWTLEAETIDDALAGADLLRKHADIDPKRVFVAGHSLGAFVAPFIGERDEKLAGIILLASNARSILDVIVDQVEYLANAGGSPNEAALKKVHDVKEATTAIRAGKLEGASEKLGMPAAYVQRVHKMNPVQAALKLKMPILIMQGGRDYQVTKADYAIWQKSLAGRKNVTFKLYEPLNHLFITGKGPSVPAEYEKPGHVDKQVIMDITGWVKAQAAQ